jgi:hypothetical protein
MSEESSQTPYRLIEDDQGRWVLQLMEDGGEVASPTESSGSSEITSPPPSCVFQFNPDGKDPTHSGWVRVSGPESCPLPSHPPDGKIPTTLTVRCP